MKSTNFWDITPCSPLSFIRRFRGTYRLDLQGRKNKPNKKPGGKHIATCFHAGFLLDPEDGGDMFLRNVGFLPSAFTLVSCSTLKMEAMFLRNVG
jgi:hypothetical protein